MLRMRKMWRRKSSSRCTVPFTISKASQNYRPGCTVSQQPVPLIYCEAEKAKKDLALYNDFLEREMNHFMKFLILIIRELRWIGKKMQQNYLKRLLNCLTTR